MSFRELPVSAGLAFNNRTSDSHFGKPEVIDSLIKIGKLWGCERSAISIGHISRKNGGKFPPHITHRDGDDVDIRPMRKDGQNLSVTWRDREYSRDLTREMIEVIRDNAPIRSILFNDPVLIGERLCQEYPNHSDHLHVNFTVVPRTRPVLKRNAKGPDVAHLQQLLAVVTVDSHFGKDTEHAVREFQAEHNLKVDGVVGKFTWGALDE